MTVRMVELLQQAVTSEDHTEFLLRTAKVGHDLQHTLFDRRCVNGHRTLTIVDTDGHVNTQRPGMGQSGFRTDAGGLKAPSVAQTDYRL